MKQVVEHPEARESLLARRVGAPFKDDSGQTGHAPN